MSTIKQILFIARPEKSKHLAQQLYILVQSCDSLSSCHRCEIYSCDDDSSEFMLFSQWSSYEGYTQFENKQLKQFEENNKHLILKKEILRLD